ncbi:helix-turn-helix transcriptional regulator [Komagataeibacter sp. FNDCF1]|uniref:ArsR/SmtB family transcription factor n=1 Tax=Komagataeibacter sp. FNDCF1 TaxID=2878681 RepID=UPI001E3649CB|nr:metalloregulator ArsR/SmtB family transcription factor [Komagataeibacter sp. FNDCF1]MCE2564089.1 metalloregulator ArsR/SmtB family transcription factor [Komagataeibacter sp. FNDCF1]
MPNLPRTRELAEHLVQRLRLLAQPQRLMVLACLLDGEKSVGEIEARTGIGQPTLSQQLAELRRAEIVVTRKEARQVIYSIKDNTEETRIRLICAVCDPDFDMERLGSLLRGRRPAGPVGQEGDAAYFARIGQDS